MPPAIEDFDNDDDSNLAEETDRSEDENASRSNSGSGSGKDRDGGGDDEEEFAVETILEHALENGELRFLVKWEGYDAEEDLTWEPEENLAEATEVLEEYFSRHGGRDSMVRVPAEKKRKRGRPSSGNGARPASTSKKARRRPAEATSPPAASQTDTKYFQPPSGSWEDDVESVDAAQDDDGKLWVYLTWKTGEHTRHNTKTVYKRCPQQMLRFYEAHIKIIPEESKDENSESEKAGK